mgnify:CR=1 FL=1
MSMSAAAAGSNDTAVYSIALKLVHGGKFAVLSNEMTCLSCKTVLWSLSG